MKKRDIVILIVAISISVALFLFVSSKQSNDSIAQLKEIVEVDEVPEASGPTTTVPWAYDDKFIQDLNKNGTYIQLAAYHTVLKDPLPGEEYNVHLAASYLAGIVVKPGEVFSQNLKIGPYSETRGFQKGPTYMGTTLTTTIGGGVCKIASTLYNVAVLSNLQIVERHSHSMPVPYVPYGQDATVAYGARDFKFKNNTSTPVMIWAQGIENVLYIAFYGSEEPPEIKWFHEVFEIKKAPTIYLKNSTLEPGDERTIFEGMDGATVKSRISIINADGSTTEKKMGISYYRPFPNIVEINQ